MGTLRAKVRESLSKLSRAFSWVTQHPPHLRSHVVARVTLEVAPLPMSFTAKQKIARSRQSPIAADLDAIHHTLISIGVDQLHVISARGLRSIAWKRGSLNRPPVSTMRRCACSHTSRNWTIAPVSSW